MMDEKLIKYYESVFHIKKERVQELINELAKDVVDRILREEIENNEYVIESIYQIGKTEDERLFLAYFIGGIKQSILATNLISILVETLIKKSMNEFFETATFYSKLPNLFLDELTSNLGFPDDETFNDKKMVEKVLLANKKLHDLIKKVMEERDENDTK